MFVIKQAGTGPYSLLSLERFRLSPSRGCEQHRVFRDPGILH